MITKSSTIGYFILFFISIFPLRSMTEKKEKINKKEIASTEMIWSTKFKNKNNTTSSLEFKFKRPINEYTMLVCKFGVQQTCGILFDNVDENGLHIPNQNREVGLGGSNKSEFAFSSLHGMFKRFVKEFYFEHKVDEFGQSIKYGIFSNGYDGLQVIGVEFDTEDISLVLDFEGMVWKVSKELNVKPENDEIFSTAFLAALELKWKSEEGDKFITGIKISKGNDQSTDSQGSNKDIENYIGSLKFQYKPKNPILDIVHGIMINYEPNVKNKTGEVINPSKFSINFDFGKVLLMEQKCNANFSVDYFFCDIRKLDFDKNTHALVSFSLDFKNFFGSKNLTCKPIIGFLIGSNLDNRMIFYLEFKNTSKCDGYYLTK